MRLAAMACKGGIEHSEGRGMAMLAFDESQSGCRGDEQFSQSKRRLEISGDGAAGRFRAQIRVLNRKRCTSAHASRTHGGGQLPWQNSHDKKSTSPRGLSRIIASRAYETVQVLLVLGEFVSHRQQEPSIRARHRLKGLYQPLYRLAQGDLIRNLGCGRLSLTDEQQLVRLHFQSFGKFFQSLERRSCISTFNTRDV